MGYGVLEHHWESVIRSTKAAEIFLPWCKVKEVVELHRGSLGGHFGVIRTLDKVRQLYYWLCWRSSVEK
jgi:hypothetical protein